MEELYIRLVVYSFYSFSAIQFFFLGIFFARMVFIKPKKKDIDVNQEGVSVVISAENEYLRLKKYLPKILEQNHPNFEVIVVNDSSTDETEYLLKELKTKYAHLSYLNVQSGVNFFKGKKFPLSMGIKSAKNDLLLLTDADCWPASEHWITEMQSAYHSNTEIVLGYGAYERKKGLLNKIIRYDTLRVAIAYFSFATWGMPYMGVGRNLSYRKNLFYTQKGFMSHYNISSGDDDLFVNKAATRKNTKVVLSANAKTISLPKKTFGAWVNQKRRHLTTGIQYKKWHLIFLGLWESSTFFFYLLGILLIVFKINLIIIGSFIAVRIILHLIITKKFMIIQNERKLLLISPLIEIFIVVFMPLLNLSNSLYKQRKWK